MLLDQRACRRVRREPRERELGVAEDPDEQVVEVVRDAAREQPQALQPLRLDELLLEQRALVLDLPSRRHVGDHADDAPPRARAVRARLTAPRIQRGSALRERETRLDLERLAARERLARAPGAEGHLTRRDQRPAPTRSPTAARPREDRAPRRRSRTTRPGPRRGRASQVTMLAACSARRSRSSLRASAACAAFRSVRSVERADPADHAAVGVGLGDDLREDLELRAVSTVARSARRGTRRDRRRCGCQTSCATALPSSGDEVEPASAERFVDRNAGDLRPAPVQVDAAALGIEPIDRDGRGGDQRLVAALALDQRGVRAQRLALVATDDASARACRRTRRA